MKLYKYILSLFAVGTLLSACDTDVENIEIQKPYTYSDLYYQNLRDYKASDHEIAWGWFSDYSQSHSLALRFMGLPDSLDICSLWGGIPTDSAVFQEMKFVQKVKGTKMVCPTIIRIENKVAYGDTEFYKLFQEGVNEGNQEKMNKAMEMYADRLLESVWKYDLDGLDLDYEPEGDRLSGANMTYFVKYIGQFIGPKSKNPDKLLCIDFYSNRPPVECEPYVNWFVNQTYGGTPNNLGFPIEKTIFTENIGDNWQTGGRLLEYARWKPGNGQRKGGFGAFFMHRDYNSNPPYKNFREGIQIQNPAIH